MVPPLENEISVVSVEAPGSLHQSSHGPENAVDGDPASSWATQTMPQNLILDLGSNQFIGETWVSFHKYDKGRTYEYSIDISSDKLNWDSLVSYAWSDSTQWKKDIYSQAYGRYVKLTLHSASNGGWTNVRELKVFRSEESIGNVGIFLGPSLQPEPILPSLMDSEDNLLNNEGFETGDKSGWSGSGSVVNDPHSGNYAYKLIGKPNRWRDLRQEVPVTANTLYRFSGHLSVRDISRGNYLFQVRWLDARNKEIRGARKNFGQSRANSDYKYHSIDLMSPENAVKARLMLQASKANGYAYYDDVSISVVEPELSQPSDPERLTIISVSDSTEENVSPQSINLLRNEGFEAGDKSGWSGSGSVVNEPHSGNYSFKLKGKRNRWRDLRQEVSVTGNVLYRFSGYLSVRDISRGTYLFQVRWFDARNREIRGTRKNFGKSRSNSDYKYHAVDLMSPANAVKARIMLQASKANGYAYYDDVSISLVDANQPTLLVSGTPAQNAIDDDIQTRWSAEGDGQWLQLELESIKQLQSLNILFHKGDVRMAYFDIDVSLDGSEWATVFDGESSGATTDYEIFDIPDTPARYVRFIGLGNSMNQWNSVSEIILFGTD